MFLLYFISLINLVSSFEFSNSKLNPIIYNKDVKSTINEIIDDNNKINFLNNPNQNWCIDCFKNYFSNENIDFTVMNYSKFINNIDKEVSKYIIVPDFMINYGRVLTLSEIEYLNKYNKYSNIIFHLNDYENLVIKNNEFIKKYKMYNFPYITKYNINNFIYNLVDYYKYDDYLQLINWNKYDIEKLDFYKLEDLLYKLHIHIIFNKKNKHNLDYIIKNDLSFLQKKYYD